MFDALTIDQYMSAHLGEPFPNNGDSVVVKKTTKQDATTSPAFRGEQTTCSYPAMDVTHLNVARSFLNNG